MGAISKRSLAVGLLAAPVWSVCNPAFAGDASAEQTVQANATRALQALDPSASADQASAQSFAAIIDGFFAFDRVATFVLGRYGGAVRADAALQADWRAAFRAYALANYELRLGRFRGRNHRVIGSTIRASGRDVIVDGEVFGGQVATPTRLSWRLVRQGDDWRAIDIAVQLNGNQVWLVQQQQAQILAMLDETHGDVRALIGRMDQSTAAIRARIQSG